jgi:hypothetical protein
MQTRRETALTGARQQRLRDAEILRRAAAAPVRGGAAALRARLREEALELARAEHLLEAAYSYRIVPLDAPPAPLLCAGGERLHAPRLLPESGTLTALGCAVCTAGPKIEARVRALFAGKRPSLALALDELGNALLFEVSRRAQDRMLADAVRRGLTFGGELRAGDPGLALDAQAAVLRLAQAEGIGVRLGSGQAMQPLKSVSMVFGIGIDLPKTRWSRCDDCSSRGKCGLAGRAATLQAA